MTRRRTIVALLVVCASLPAVADGGSATVPQAAARVRTAIPAMEFYRAEHGTYAGATAAKLRSIVRAVRYVSVKRATRTGYCIQSTLPGPVVHYDGPKGPLRRGPCGVRGAVVPAVNAVSDTTTDPAVAKEQLRMAVSAVEMYAYDNGGYSGMTPAKIRELDAGVQAIRVVWAVSKSYCLESGSGSATHHLRGPGGLVAAGRCPAAP